jgi:CRISP-associated protein Cas1
VRRIVEIAGEGRVLTKERGFLVVSHQKQELGRTPLDSVLAVLDNGHGLMVSSNALVALAAQNAPVVLCGSNHLPAAIVWPVETHHQQAGRFDAQHNAKKPMLKQRWKQVVVAKILGQEMVLKHYGLNTERLAYYARQVTSGDTTNREALAAQLYWPRLFGKEFRRRPEEDGLNALLNYGYAIIRSAVARSIMAYGLHPGFALHHSNTGNPLRLVDDMMEPFRPFVDAMVKKLAQEGHSSVTSETKKILATLPYRRLRFNNTSTSLLQAMEECASSLVQVLEGHRQELSFPPRVLPDLTTGNLPNAFDRISTDVDDGDV